MKKLLALVCLFVLLALPVYGASVYITSPAPSETLAGDTVTVEFDVDIDIIPGGNHVHFTMDNAGVDDGLHPWYSADPYTFPETFSSGTHTVHAWLVNYIGYPFNPLYHPDAYDSVTFTIGGGSGPDCTDDDGDGFATEGGDCGLVDCDDSDSDVNPGADESPGNGIDDDCDAQTPDEVAGLIFTQIEVNDYSVDSGDCFPGQCTPQATPSQDIIISSDAREEGGGSLISCSLTLYRPNGQVAALGSGWTHGSIAPDCSGTMWIKDTPSTPYGVYTLEATVTGTSGTQMRSLQIAYGHSTPIIQSVSHSPVEPDNTDNVIVEATVLGYHDTMAAQVHYTINGGAEQTTVMTQDVFDFQADLGSFQAGDSIEYYVEASDTVSPSLTTDSASDQFDVLNSCDLPPLCANQFGVCADSVATSCSDGVWDACTVQDYTSHSSDFQEIESVCDGLDNDCDGTVDNEFDVDQDGYFPDTCSGYGEYDCDDSDNSVNPGNQEIPFNGLDDDCDAATLDDNCDNDGDGYDTFVAGFCAGDDCDDSNAAISPGLPETPYDGLDNDCNAATLDDDLDQDGLTHDLDCDDNDATTLDIATKICGQSDVGICTYGQETCIDGVWNNDCDAILAATEVCGNGIDEDCDGNDKTCNIVRTSGGSPLLLKGGSGGSTLPQYPYAAQKFSKLLAGGNAELTISKSGLPVTKLVVTVKEESRDVEFKVSAHDSPDEASELEQIYKYLKVEHTNLDNSAISGASFTFEVEASWLEENGFSAEDIVLMRFSEGAWEELMTTQIGVSDGSIVFRAESPGLSEFAIKASKVVVEEEPVVQEQPEEEPETEQLEQEALEQDDSADLVQELDRGSSKKITYVLAILALLIIALAGYLAFKTPDDEKKDNKQKK